MDIPANQIIPRIPATPPEIFPVAEGLSRPLWSVMIPAYNCSPYIRETILSVLLQDPGKEKMQIVVVDDASTDEDIASLVVEMGKGRIDYFRQPSNVGSVRNFETCLNLSTGKYIHLLHGDDKIMPGYYETMEKLFEQFPSAGAAFCSFDHIDEKGELIYHTATYAKEPDLLPHFMDLITRKQIVQYSSITVKREVYEKLGGFFGVDYGEDWEMWARIGERYPIAYSPEILAAYRVHQNSISSDKFYSGKHLQDLDKVFKKILNYLPDQRKENANKSLRKNYLKWALNVTRESWFFYHDKQLVYNQLNESGKFYKDWETQKSIFRLRMLLWRTGRNPVYPFYIMQVDLSVGLQMPTEAALQNEGCYSYYWWKNIPLGHVIWPKTFKENEQTKKSFVAASIGPALLYYGQKAGITEGLPTSWDNVTASVMDQFLPVIMNSFLVVETPESVPVSVIICTHNRSQFLKTCLLNLQQQVCKPGEIIVVDNAPEKYGNLTKQLVEQFKGVIYCEEKRTGLDYARNTGGHLAAYPIVAFIDDDVTLEPLWLFQVWTSFQDETVDAMTGLVLPLELETQSQQIFEQYWGFNKGYTDKEFDHSFLRGKGLAAPAVWEIGAGANMAFRKKTLEKVNYFDERLDAGASGCNGDSEIWFRILLSDLKIVYNPRAVVYHYHRSEMRSLINQLHNYIRGHVSAALIQGDQAPGLHYRLRVFLKMPAHYLLLMIKGFPFYNGRYITLFREIRGYFSGLLFYRQNRKRPLAKYKLCKLSKDE
jgi:glycosyltransferase involved in cell wall biosynthesis